MSEQGRGIIILSVISMRCILFSIVVMCCMTISSKLEAARVIVNTGLDSQENCSFRQAVAVINNGAVFSNGDCVNSGGPFGQNDSIVFDSDISTVSLGVDLSTFLVIYTDVSINNGGPRITIDGERAPRTVITIVSGANVRLHNLHITGGEGGLSFDDRAGGIYVRNSKLTITDSSISGNFGIGGSAGGLAINNSNVTVINSEVSDNFNDIEVGGVSISSSSLVKLVNSTVSRNIGYFGGGITSFDSSLEIINSTISSNRMTESDLPTGFSGVSVNSGNAVIYNSTISDNIGPKNVSSSRNRSSVGTDLGTIVLKNTIIANSVDQKDCFFTPLIGLEPPRVIFDGSNLVEDGSCDSDNLDKVINKDPKLDKLGFNRGKTRTHALLVGSPAIDAGDDAICRSSKVRNLDQRGIRRPVGAACDLGSYEGSKKIVPSLIFPLIPLLLDEDE